MMLSTAATAALAESPHPGRERETQLIRLVRQDCGSCHGMRLTGGLGPALTPAALQDKPADALVQAILQGRPGTPMPPWKNFISGPEAVWIVDGLKKGFPDVR
ncbi:MAG: c-type cytochrome [Thiobacillus sp.]